MSASIRNTITTALAAEGINADGYGSYIDVAVSALQEREYTLTDQITERVMEEFGVSTEQVRGELENIGAEVRPIPEPEVVEPEAPKTTDEKVDALTEALATLAGTVGKLVTLAETKLGATL